MGNYRFRLSDMNPNVWFQKLIKSRKKNPTSSSSSSLSSFSCNSSSLAPVPPQKSNLSDQRKSYYFTRDLNSRAEPARKSSRRRRRSTKKSRKTPPRFISSPPSACCNCRAATESAWTNKQPPEEYRNSLLSQTSSTSDNDSILPEYGSDRDLTPDTFDGAFSWSTSGCKCSNDKEDREINVDDEFDTGDLPPIITKKKQEPTKIQRTSTEFSEKNAHGSLSVKVVKEEYYGSANKEPHQISKKSASPVRRYLANPSSPGMKLRTNSPRIANRRRILGGRKSASSASSLSHKRSVSESFAVVKASKDPGKDFRESMMEMIKENKIRASKDLEELLACYLSLNSNEYHGLIIDVFKQIWFDNLHIHLK